MSAVQQRQRPASVRPTGAAQWPPVQRGLLGVALLLVSLGGATGQIGTPTLWTDVCEAEDLAKYRDALCKTTFLVSTLAFNPLAPNSVANVTVLLQPSEKLPKDTWLAREQWIEIYLPGFEPVGSVSWDTATNRDLALTPMNPVEAGIDPAQGYNTIVNPLFRDKAIYNTLNGVLRLYLIKPLQMLPDRDTEVMICCMKLPNMSPKNEPTYRISAPTNEGALAISITDEPIKDTPYIDPGYQFEFLEVLFNPPVSMQLCTISLTLRPANNLKDRDQIILHMPQIIRVQNEDGALEFSTAYSANPLDWMLFSSQALWNNTAKSLAFFLREGQVLAAGRQVTLRTMPGDFRLPVNIEPNSNDITVEARSLDGIDQIIASTVVGQSSNVPHVREFPYSALMYRQIFPNAQTDVIFSFMTNRPLFTGTGMYLRLSGFRSDVVDVVLIGPSKAYFANERATFHLPDNIMELNVTRPMYSNEMVQRLVFSQLFLPPALYVNDASLLVWTSDPDALREPITTSPEVCADVCGGEQKTFVRSQIAFEPAEPRLPSNVTFTILPSIFFYQGDEIVLHLYGFICQSFYIPLLGSGASKIDQRAARWYGEEYMLVLTVGKNQIIDNVNPLIVMISRDAGLRLPGLLSKNDGTLRVEGRGAIITERPLKKVPTMGDPKLVISSRVEIEPDWSTGSATPYARISISFILNSDVLPSSTFVIKLGGILRNPPAVAATPVGFSAGRSGEVVLSGTNAPLFYGVGQWNHDSSVLTLNMKPLYIYAGEYIRFFLEKDTYFQLPPASYPNDPAFRIAFPGAGIAEEQFLYSTKWVDKIKRFELTDLRYGDKSQVWYPGDSPDFNFKFKPNVDLYAGTVITLTLPGFISSSPTIILSPPETAVSNEYDISGFIPTGQWDQLTQTLTLTVPIGNAISQRVNVMRVRAIGNFGFMLPVTALAKNDPRLRIKCGQNQFIYEEPIQTSPRVVRRTFLISRFEYLPPVRESIFMFLMTLQPSVNISWPADINIELGGFRNALSKQKIEITGASRAFVKGAEGQWNESTEILTLPMIFNGPVIIADTILNFRIEESQGFILPSKLRRNDPSIRISSVNNILSEPVQESPMVGNMPYSPHRFCMYQYEDGVRTRDPICETAKDCEPPLTDPCNTAELKRCGCESRLDEKFNFTIEGFNLEDTDKMYFQPYTQLCSLEEKPQFLGAFTLQQGKPTISAEQDKAEFYGFQSTRTGFFRVCYLHAGVLFDIGFVAVRPSCRSSQHVMVGGTCVEHCPETKIPVAGACLPDPHAVADTDSQALMLQVRMTDPAVAGAHLSDRSSGDQEVRYFVYRYIYELARLLNCDPKRLEVASLSKGSTLVNTIFKTVGDEDARAASSERSPRALISLLRALQSDTSSSMYESAFFQNIGKPQSLSQIVGRLYDPPPIEVRMCTDGVYRTFCPYARDIISSGSGNTYFVIGFLVVPTVLVLVCACAWRLDYEAAGAVDEDILEKLRRDPKMVDSSLQVEYARSWLEGRFMGEEWERARRTKFMALGN